MSDQKSRTNDELLSLAFSLHANPGAYALLIGAGASFSSGIPVAWDVLLDLCRKAAAADGEDIGEEAPDGWWERTRSEKPTYSRVLERLAPTAALRQALLEGYFEVSDTDREAGIKQPTAAHAGIARLVALGTVKVIITLNFDRLIEQALRAAGIEPTVITHPSEIEGMRPLHQIDCVVIHLHGDYRNPDSMLNTENELDKYSPAARKLLKRILKDYGLLIAGWSAKHDRGLREAIQSWHTNFARYPLVWIDPFGLGVDASALRGQKRGTLLQSTADDALGKLADAVTSLRSRNAVHPLSVPVAVATAKRELSGRAVAVAVHDTLAKAFAALHQHPDFKYDNRSDAEAVGYLTILERIEESTTLSAALTATLAYWGNESTDRWWLGELERFSYRTQGGGDTRLLEVRRVAGLWLFYAAGVSAVLAGRWQLLADMFSIWVPSRSSYDGTRQSLAKFYEPGATYKAPQHASAFFEALRPILTEATSASAEALDEAWQTFELLRYTRQVMEVEKFSDLCGAYWRASLTLEQAQTAYDIARAGNSAGDLTQLQTSRREAWQEVGLLTGQIVRQTTYEHVHVLTADAHSQDRGWVVPLATKLGDEVRVLGDAHHFITSGLGDGSVAFMVALDAVSAGLGMLGREVAYGQLPPEGGAVSGTMWLDTQDTMYERGPRTLPV